MSGVTAKYEVRDAEDGSFYYVLKAANGEVLSTSETYETREHAEEGIEAAQSASAAAAVALKEA
jgi:hypothetical protein